MFSSLILLAASGVVKGSVVEPRQASTSVVAQYFQTTPELYAGMCCAWERSSLLDSSSSRSYTHRNSSVPRRLQPRTLWHGILIHAREPVRDCPAHCRCSSTHGQ